MVDPMIVYSADSRERYHEQLSYGNYRCMIEVRGVYLGPHGTLQKFSSLQLKVVQLLFSPRTTEMEGCLFLPDSPREEETTTDSMADIDEIITKVLNEESTPRPKIGCKPTSSELNSTRAGGIAKRRKVNLRLNLGDGAIQQQIAEQDRIKKGKELLEYYSRLDYPTQDPTVEELEARMAKLKELSGQLVVLLGDDWHRTYYADYLNEKAHQFDCHMPPLQ